MFFSNPEQVALIYLGAIGALCPHCGHETNAVSPVLRRARD